MIERMAEKIVNYQIREGKISEDDFAVYYYGYLLMGEIGGNILVSMIIGFIIMDTISVIVFLLSFIWLRTYAGGFHMDKTWKCTVLTNLIVLLVCFCSGGIQENYCRIMFFTDFVVCMGISRLSPVAACNKALNEKEMMIYKDKSARICWMEFTCSGILLFAGYVKWSWIIMMAHYVTLLSQIIEKVRKRG